MNTLADDLRIAVAMLRARPLRSALSLLGIYLGMLALIVILAIHAGTLRRIEELFRTEGAQIVLVQPGYDEALGKIGRVTSELAFRVRNSPRVQSVMLRLNDDKTLRVGSRSVQIACQGIDDVFLSIYRIPVKAGRGLLPQESESRQAVILLTPETAEKLFPYSDPIGERVDMEGVMFQVIGIVEWDAAASQRAFVHKAQAFVPAGWLAKDKDFIRMMEIRLDANASVLEAVDDVERLVTLNDPTQKKMFQVQSLQEYVQESRESHMRTLKSLLAIAAVSLLVGGIGVANVMLTSVTERIREIGLRKALGARRRDLVRQFLVEAAVLTAFGGFLALVTGVGGVLLLPSFVSMDIPLALAWGPMLTCWALTFVIGLLAGLYPASRAAALDPVEALRYE
jgi:putative ABC transport system permease protein